jgi:hypothetical protein
MVRDRNGGTLPGLAAHRVKGMPFTVSEYNHPAPLDASAEGLMEIAATACLQDWDGFFLFDYCGSRDEFHSDRIKGFFSVDTHPGKMALMPAAARLFLRGDLAPLGDEVTLEAPADRIPSLTARFGQDVLALWRGQGIEAVDLLSGRADVRFVSRSAVRLVRSEPRPRPEAPPFEWIPQPADAARCRYASATSVGVIGYVGGRTERVGAVRFAVEKTASDFAVLTVSSLDARPIPASRSLLVTAVGRVENTGMGWNADRTSVGDRWGHGPTIAEGIPADIQIETRARTAAVYALTPNGARGRVVPSTLSDGVLRFHIGPGERTLWYEVVSE